MAVWLLQYWKLNACWLDNQWRNSFRNSKALVWGSVVCYEKKLGNVDLTRRTTPSIKKHRLQK